MYRCMYILHIDVYVYRNRYIDVYIYIEREIDGYAYRQIDAYIDIYIERERDVLIYIFLIPNHQKILTPGHYFCLRFDPKSPKNPYPRS